VVLWVQVITVLLRGTALLPASHPTAHQNEAGKDTHGPHVDSPYPD